MTNNMEKDWSDKARENAYYWVDSRNKTWNREEFYKQGELEVATYLGDFIDSTKNLLYGDLRTMRALDIGCGTGRITVALAKYFAYVDGIDISDEMIRIAKRDNPGVGNVGFRTTSGVDLGMLSDQTYDFIFSFLVFQHIPQKSLVINYMKEIYRVMRRGAYTQFQVRGYPAQLPSGLSQNRYYGFDRFYIALSRKKGFPFPVIYTYNTLLGSFFKQEELRKIAEIIGYDRIETFYSDSGKKYLWMRARRPL